MAAIPGPSAREDVQGREDEACRGSGARTGCCAHCKGTWEQNNKTEPGCTAIWSKLAWIAPSLSVESQAHGLCRECPQLHTYQTEGETPRILLTKYKRASGILPLPHAVIKGPNPSWVPGSP